MSNCFRKKDVWNTGHSDIFLLNFLSSANFKYLTTVIFFSNITIFFSFLHTLETWTFWSRIRIIWVLILHRIFNRRTWSTQDPVKSLKYKNMCVMWVHKDLDPIVFRKTFLHNLFDILAWDMRRIEITILAQKMLPKSLDKLIKSVILQNCLRKKGKFLTVDLNDCLLSK